MSASMRPGSSVMTWTKWQGKKRRADVAAQKRRFEDTAIRSIPNSWSDTPVEKKAVNAKQRVEYATRMKAN